MKNTGKRWIAWLLMLCIGLTVPQAVYADYPTELQTEAEGYVIYDATDGTVIAGKNQDTPYYPASTTKIMTALLVCENVPDLDAQITFTQTALAEMTADSSTLTPMAAVGEKMTVRDVLYGMFLVSGNECAAQLGEYVAGSTEQFAKMMNDRAAQIGCLKTQFKNAHGLHDEGHYTTPCELAMIFGEALKNERFLEMATTLEYTIPATNMCREPRELTSTHLIVNGTQPYPEVFAGKTGRTPQAGRTLATAAKFNGHTVIVIVMKSTDDDFYDDTFRLLEYARGYYDGLYTDMTWTDCDETVYVVGTNSLRVRTYPCEKGTISVGTLQYGQSVKRVATWGMWSQIEYMGALYYVHSDYLSVEVPPEEFDPNSTIPETTRPTVDISVVPDTTQDSSETAEEESSKSVATLPPSDSESGPGIPTQSQPHEVDPRHSVIMTVMVVCIVLMLLIAGTCVFMTVQAHRRKRKRHKRYWRDDDWYQQ